MSYRYRMGLFNNDNTTQTSQYIQHDWPQMMRYNTGTHNSYEYMDEYICIPCSTSLQRSKPKMPDQACANNLNLDDIPQDLTELSTMERRLISYRLPFMTLIAMKRYGGHYKVNGPPVNILAKLDQMLPRMPNELQSIPLKLKHKLEYKSYYMYDIVCRDCIIGSLTWLKNQNQFYNQIPINYNWCSTVPDSDIPDLLISGGNVDLSEESMTNTEHLKGNTLCEEDVICDICENDTVNNVVDSVTLHQNSMWHRQL